MKNFKHKLLIYGIDLNSLHRKNRKYTGYIDWILKYGFLPGANKLIQLYYDQQIIILFKIYVIKVTQLATQS